MTRFMKVEKIRANAGTNTLISLDDLTLQLVDTIYDDFKENLHIRPSMTVLIRRALRIYAAKLNGLDMEEWLSEKELVKIAAAGEEELN